MTGLDIEAIRADVSQHAGHLTRLDCCVAHDVASHLPALLAEIERLTTARSWLDSENARLRTAWADAQGRLADAIEERDDAREGR